MDSDAVGLLLTRFAWIGAGISFVAWLFASRQIWTVEGSLHHLIARMLSVATMLALDVAIVLLFWPDQFVAPPIELSIDQVRVLVAFIVGMQIMAAVYQLTAPKQGRVTRDGRRTR